MISPSTHIVFVDRRVPPEEVLDALDPDRFELQMNPVVVRLLLHGPRDRVEITVFGCEEHPQPGSMWADELYLYYESRELCPVDPFALIAFAVAFPEVIKERPVATQFTDEGGNQCFVWMAYRDGKIRVIINRVMSDMGPGWDASRQYFAGVARAT